MKRILIACLATVALALPAHATDMNKTLRVAFPVDVTGFDPAGTSDLYSAHIDNAIFGNLWEYDYYVRPVRFRPFLAETMPEISADGLVWKVRLRKGLYFSDDPLFKGKKREATAEDLIYSWKRLIDPKIISPKATELSGKLVGLDDLVAQAKATGKFDYDKPIEGLKALDRYTVQMTFVRPAYTIVELMQQYNWSPVAREVIEAHRDPGGRAMGHPVGVGPYMIKSWAKGSKIVLTRNPNFTVGVFPTDGEPGDAETLAKYKGQSLPIIGNVEVSIIEEANPRLLTFKSGLLDYEFVGADLIGNVVKDGKLVAEYAEKGIRHQRALESAIAYDYFNLLDPMVGGYTPDRIALRRAIIMAYPTEQSLKTVWRNQAVAANQIIPPTQTGHVANRPNLGAYDVQLANALLDHYGYKDVNGDGWRDMPDGKPLLVTRSSTPRATDREQDELWKKAFDSLKIKLQFNNQKWPDLIKQARAKQLQFWSLGWISDGTDGDSFVGLLYSKNSGQSNFSNFDVKQYDELYEKAQTLPLGPQRWALYKTMNDIATVNTAWYPGVFRYQNVLVQPWLLNYKRNPYRQHFWHLMDIDETKRPKS
ncbi:MAG: ABC transporter substrate-binding protein [Casimicrobium sp.]